MHDTFGTFGAWLNPALGDDPRIDYAPELEDLGYHTIWLGIGLEPVGELGLLERVLRATRRANVATAIINMWQDSAADVADGYHRLADEFGPRVILGIGLGHPETRQTYEQPLERMTAYLDSLRSAAVPPEAMLLGALGRRALTLAAERTLGSHPYLSTPEHTRYARDTMVPSAFLAPEHKVVLTEDGELAHAIGKPAIQNPYLGLKNYTNNLLRHGFTHDDISAGGSDRLVDALVTHGSVSGIITALGEHLEAGANHVGRQVLSGGDTSPMPGYRALARHLTQTNAFTA